MSGPPDPNTLDGAQAGGRAKIRRQHTGSGRRRHSSRIYAAEPEHVVPEDMLKHLGNLSPTKQVTEQKQPRATDENIPSKRDSTVPDGKSGSSRFSVRHFEPLQHLINRDNATKERTRIEVLHHNRPRPKKEASKDGAEGEEHHVHEKNWFPVIEHDSWEKVIWDVIISLSVLFLLFFLPMDISFDFYAASKGLKTFTSVLDYIFYIDIFLNFNTAFVHDGHVHYSKKEIRAHYLGSWFIVDLLASIPFELFLQLEKSDRKSVKILKYFKLPKLLRLSTIFKYFMRYMKYWNVTQTVALLIVLLHFAACFWVSAVEPCVVDLGLTDERNANLEDNLHKDVYTFRRLADDSAYDVAGPQECGNAHVWDFYSKAIHTATLMIFLQADVFANDENFDLPLRDSIEFGRSGYTTFLAIFFGAIGFALILNMTGFVVAQAMYRRDSYTSFFRMYDRVNDEMQYHNLPLDIRYRVKKFYDYLWMHNKRPGTRSALSAFTDLSSSLQKEISVVLYKGALTKVALFSDVSDDCIYSVAMKLRTHIFLPDDVVVQRGEIAREMYIVQKGEVEVVRDVHSSDVVMVMVEGDFFGEVALLTHNRRNMTVRARTVAELHTLTKQDLDEVLTDFPDVRSKIQDIASDRGTPQQTKDKRKASRGRTTIAGGEADLSSLGSVGGGNTFDLLEDASMEGPLLPALGEVLHEGAEEDSSSTWAHIGATSTDRLEQRLETHIEHHVEKHIDRSIKIMSAHIESHVEKHVEAHVDRSIRQMEERVMAALNSGRGSPGTTLANEAQRELDKAQVAKQG